MDNNVDFPLMENNENIIKKDDMSNFDFSSKGMRKEIFLEKFNIYFWISFLSLSLLLTVIVLILNTTYIDTFKKVINFIFVIKKDKEFYLKMSKTITIFLSLLIIIKIMLIIYNIYRYIILKNEIENFKTNININSNHVPMFIIKKYKKLITKQIYLNWSFAPVSLMLFTINIFILILDCVGAFGQNNEWQDKTAISIWIIITIIIIISALLTLIMKIRLLQINTLFSFQILNEDEILRIKQRAHKICKVIWIIILIIIFIPLYIIKLIRKK